MTKQDIDDQHDRYTTRRQLIRTGAAVGTTVIPLFASTATAQTDAEGQSTDADDEDREVTLTAALPADAPTYGNPDDDYTGLFVQAGNRKGNVDPSGINSCAFVASEDIEKVWGYNAEMFDRRDGDTGGETTTLYALAENPSIGPDKRYIVNDSQPCGDYVEVELEALQTRNISGPETATPGGGGGGADTTEATTPGFDIVAALGGIVTAIAGALATHGGEGDK